MRLFVTGATGVIGQALLPLAATAGHHVEAPGHGELDLFDAGAVRDAVSEADAIPVQRRRRELPLDRLRPRSREPGGQVHSGGPPGGRPPAGPALGPGTGQERPNLTFGAALHVEDAARALLAAIDAPGGTYEVGSASERTSITAFHEATGWSPRH